MGALRHGRRHEAVALGDVAPVVADLDDAVVLVDEDDVRVVAARVLVKEKIGDPGVRRLREAGLEVDLGLDWEDGQLAERIGEYFDAGLSHFIFSGYPHLEEAFHVGEGVIPELHRLGYGVKNRPAPEGERRAAQVPFAPVAASSSISS